MSEKCPNCGHCPHCGRSNFGPYRPYPYWSVIPPNYQPYVQPNTVSPQWTSGGTIFNS